MKLNIRTFQIGSQRSSSSALMYNELNEKIERFSKWTYIALVYLTTAATVLPSVFLSAFNYTIYDLKDESFQMSTKIMYVKD